MRKTIILITALCFSTIVSYTQIAFTPETNLGIKLGNTLSRVGFNPNIDQGLNLGYTGGFVFKHISQKSLGIQLELNYLQAGWSENLDSTNTYSRRLDYIQIPFMTHVCFGEGKTRFILNIGSYLSFLASDREKIGLINEEEEQIYYRQEIGNRIEFGLCLGLGLSRNTTIGLFQLEGRVNYSFSNIFNNTPETPFKAAQNQIVELALSYFLELKR